MNSDAIRRLGAIELSMAYNHQLLGGNTQGCQLVKIDALLPAEIIKAAAKELFLHFDALQSCISEKNGVPYFCYMRDFANIEVSHSTLNLSQTWQSVFEDEVNAAIDQSVACWRLSSYFDPIGSATLIIITIHHSIVDASGVVAALKYLLSVIDRMIAGKQINREASVIFPLPIDNFLLESKAPPAPHNESVEHISHARHPVMVCDRRTRMELFTIGNEDLSLLNALCKSMRVSANSLFVSLFVRSCNHAGLFQKRIDLKSAVSLRARTPYTESGNHQLGCYITVTNCTFDLGMSNDVFDLCRSYDAQLFSAMLKTLPYKSSTSLVQLKSSVDQMVSQSSFVHGLGITNAGYIEKGDYKGFNVLDWQSSNNRCGGNVAIVLHVIQFDHRLNLGLVYSEPLINDDIVRSVHLSFRNALNDFIQLRNEKEEDRLVRN